MANIHINSETSTHQKLFSAKTIDILALFGIFLAFLDMSRIIRDRYEVSCPCRDTL